MGRARPHTISRRTFELAAEEYLASLPLEHFMEVPPTATQRKITLASLDHLADERPDVHVFNECLVMYPKPDDRRGVGRVVPDNMIVVYDGELTVESRYEVPYQPVGLFMTLEYVSESSQRKDYDDNMRRYEQDLRVPYYLLFEPEKQLLLLYKLNTRRRYSSVRPSGDERYAIPELELEVGTVDGWVRYWFRGRLIPLTREMKHQLRDATASARRFERQSQKDRQKLERAEAEIAELRAELDRLRGTG